MYSGTRLYVRRPINTRFISRYTIKTVKCGGKSLMLWGFIKIDGCRTLIKCPERLDSFNNQIVLNEELFSVYDATCHRSKLSIDYLESYGICYLSD